VEGFWKSFTPASIIQIIVLIVAAILFWYRSEDRLSRLESAYAEMSKLMMETEKSNAKDDALQDVQIAVLRARFDAMTGQR